MSPDAYDDAYDEARAELLRKIWKQIEKGADLQAWILERARKIENGGHWPEHVNRIEE